jgi:SNF2 family DNA or RNA helicase
MSGTPAKKKGADVWGVLHWLRPDAFPSQWRFAHDFFEVIENHFGVKYGALRPDAEAEFAAALTPYCVRRTKDECLPWLPPKLHVPVWCTMSARQRKQYDAMDDDGFLMMGQHELSTTSVLAEFTRLSQFANAYCEWEGEEVTPTVDSCKLEAMLEKMDEADVFDDPTQKQLVFSQSERMIRLVAGVLEAKGIKVTIISGRTHKRKGQLRAAIESFQTGETQVMCIVTQAGGVSLTLDRADVAHFIDEAWAPDETEQAEDRMHRATTGTKQVTVFHYYASDSIDEYRKDVADGKRTAHEVMWDIRRKKLRAKEKVS